MSAVATLVPDAPAARADDLDAVRRQIQADHLTERSPGRVVMRTLALVAIWCGASAAAAATGHWWAWGGAWWVQSLCLVGSYSAMHEATHGALARGRSRNRVLAGLWGLTILWNASLWRQFHLAHHAYTGTDRDPEPYEDATSLPRYLIGIPLAGVGFVVAQLALSTQVAFGRPAPSWLRASGRRESRINGLILLGWTALLIAATVARPGLLLQLWVGPYLLAVLLVAPATGITEHYGCRRGLGERPVTNPFATTRTVITNRVVRFIFWQNNYHAAHHAFPNVPAHHAAELHRLVAERTIHLSPGYLRFHWGEIRQLVAARR